MKFVWKLFFEHLKTRSTSTLWTIYRKWKKKTKCTIGPKIVFEPISICSKISFELVSRNKRTPSVREVDREVIMNPPLYVQKPFSKLDSRNEKRKEKREV